MHISAAAARPAAAAVDGGRHWVSELFDNVLLSHAFEFLKLINELAKRLKLIM